MIIKFLNVAKLIILFINYLLFLQCCQTGILTSILLSFMKYKFQIYIQFAISCLELIEARRALKDGKLQEFRLPLQKDTEIRFSFLIAQFSVNNFDCYDPF